MGKHNLNHTKQAHQAPRHSLVRVVLFDLDGTLIDSAPDLGAAVDKTIVLWLEPVQGACLNWRLA